MSNGSPHDPGARGEGYGYGQGYGQQYGDGYGSGYGEYGDEGGWGEYGQQPPQAQQSGGQHYPSYPQDGSYPQEGWGGESDQDATAFVQLPAGPLPAPGAGADAWGPLAAPGTGQGGYTPPPFDPAEVTGPQPAEQPGPPDETAGGQWAMPFGQGAGVPGGHDHASYGQHHEGRYPQHQDQHPGGHGAFGGAPAPEPGGRHERQDPGPAPAMGQGAAAALAGSHEARTQRRPLGTGGGVTAEEAEPIGTGRQFSGPAAPRQTPGQHHQDTAGDAHYEEAHARRQVPFDGPEAVADASAGGAAPGEAAGAPSAAPHTSEAPPAGDTAGDAGAGTTEEETGAEETGAEETEARPAMGTVRSGLPWTPSSGPAVATSAPADSPVTDSPGAGGPEPEQQPDTDHGPDRGATAAGDSWAVPPAPGGATAPATREAAEETPSDSREPRGDDATSTDRGDGEAPTDSEVSEEPPLQLAPELGGEHPHVSYVLHVNGIDRPVTDAWIGESLLYVLRERLGLAGAKDGCSQGECGACSVQVDGRLVASCLVPAATAAGSEIRTVEGLAVDGVPSDVQRALTESGAVQCGFCVPGLAMTVHDLLEGNHAPSELETRKAICGNLCRCSGYRGVLDAVRTVVSERAEQAAREQAEAEAEAEAYEQESAGGPARIPHQAGPGAGGAYYPGGGA
ncbi:2Fe-2S iron-sulfur cluster-binding protein [Streptomyces sp. WMMB 322]|uniref:2Fe-2S iron-sulfur cluster-binding protein n=1 Tax=Streptomyces sp. WMMB 322 TaxID=1286821 RepID=UPI0006E1675A|nr:2Fe-2S iron-sulfur cluster-binding protein [Streptomyces sp. WMMB 322]SCK20902.1 Aerobic-type carbon monoxide dehydrogenase, small subunit, CoxS/CutS family [Streptomyces sp. WMMB 322]